MDSAQDQDQHDDRGLHDERAPEYDRDEDQLGLLTVFFYVMAGLHLVGCAAGGVHLFLAWFLPEFIASIPPGPNPPPPEMGQAMGVFFGFLGVVIIVLSTVMTAVTAYAGRCLQMRRARTFVIVVAAFHLLSMPFGTALGIFTIIVLSRPRVADWFDGGGREAAVSRASRDVRS